MAAGGLALPTIAARVWHDRDANPTLTRTKAENNRLYYYSHKAAINVAPEGDGEAVIDVFGINDVLYDKIEENVNLSGSSSKIVDLWLEAKPIIIEHSEFTKNQFIELPYKMNFWNVLQSFLTTS